MTQPHAGLAASLMALGRQQAERIVAEARREADVLREQARADGLRQGREAGEQEIRARYEAWQASVRSALEAHMEQRLQAWSDSLEQHLVDLAIDIARTVIGDAVAEGAVPATVQRVREALHAMGQQQRATVFASLEGIDTLEEALRAAGLPVGDLAVVGRADIEPGFCRVESAHGMTDATLKVQLQRIQDHVSHS